MQCRSRCVTELLRVIRDCGELEEAVVDGEVDIAVELPAARRVWRKILQWGQEQGKTNIEYSATKCRDANCL